MDNNLYSIMSSINNMNRPNLKELEETEEYKTLSVNTDNFLTIWKILKGKEVTVIGDVRRIEITGKNRVYLQITYSLRPDMLYKEQTKIFEIVEDRQKEYVKCHILPTTGIELIAKYTGYSDFNSNNKTPFKVVKINKINQKLNFGYYICAGDNPDLESGSDICRYNFGYNKNEIRENYCCLCGSNLKYIDDIYKKNN